MSGIGLPKGMSRDDAYVQGLADAEEREALTRRTLAKNAGYCPGSWLRKENQLPRPGSVPCPECGLRIGLIFDQDNIAYYGGHTINLRCRYCGESQVEASGKAKVFCWRCNKTAKGIPA